MYSDPLALSAFPKFREFDKLALDTDPRFHLGIFGIFRLCEGAAHLVQLFSELVDLLLLLLVMFNLVLQQRT